ncbi:MAG: hypothetical protein U0531_04375 [Dehalococcoidia bacterium]
MTAHEHQEDVTMRLNGAQILLECLVREGVDVIYGYPGGVVLPLYDKFPEYPQAQARARAARTGRRPHGGRLRPRLG